MRNLNEGGYMNSTTESQQAILEPEFIGFQKIPRLSRSIIITEKIDGSNGQILVTNDAEVWIGSRSHWLWHTGQELPKDDNYGFARWCSERIDEIKVLLGPGSHYGEFWGSGINRGYSLVKGEKRFSLFNVTRWRDQPLPRDFYVVPILAEHDAFNTTLIIAELEQLVFGGSRAVPGYSNPEC